VAADGGGDLGGEPGFGGAGVGGIEGEAAGEDFACVGGALGEFRERGPGGFGIDVVGGDGGNAAPVVDPRGEEARVVRGRG
jgi:hypothetical protein